MSGPCEAKQAEAFMTAIWRMWNRAADDMLMNGDGRTIACSTAFANLLRNDKTLDMFDRIKDNAAKAILDAMTDFQFWKDDSVVFALEICKEWTDGKPGAYIKVTPTDSQEHP